MQLSDLRQTVVDQQQESARLLTEMAIKRDVEAKLGDVFTDRLVKVITGVRRCGKSFLAHQLVRGRNYGYLNFDDERFFSITASDLNGLLEILLILTPKLDTILLDEVQNVVGWELFANRLQRMGYQLVVTGSNSKLLSRELATHLTGRHRAIELYPFSFKEFLRYRGTTITQSAFSTEERAILRREFEIYLASGGFPESWRAAAPQEYLQDLFAKIISRDIVERRQVRFPSTLREIGRYLLLNIGSPCTYNKLKNIFSLGSTHTAQKYLDFLEEAYLLFSLNRFSYKFKEKIIGAKKIYGIDTGILNAINKEKMNQGHLLENIVFLELKRRKMETLNFNNGNHEVDFVIADRNKAAHLIQVCWNLDDDQTREREFKALAKVMAEFSNAEAFIITGEYEGELTVGRKKIPAVPIWRWLLRPGN